MTEYFPGSRQVVTPPSGPPDPLGGRKGKEYPFSDGVIELFGIGDVAAVLNRETVTIRKWERQGVIPKATFIKPSANKDPRGRRRLYSRAQVEAMVRIAQAEGILYDKHRRVGSTQFTAKVFQAFRELAKR